MKNNLVSPSRDLRHVMPSEMMRDQADDIEGVDGIELPAIPEKGDVTGLLRNFQNNQNKK